MRSMMRCFRVGLFALGIVVAGGVPAAAPVAGEHPLSAQTATAVPGWRLFHDNENVSMQDADFPEEYRTGVTLVYFTKPGCPACAKQDPIYKEVVSNLPAQAHAYEVYEYMINLDLYKVTELPTLVIFRDGRECRRFVGVTAGKKLLSAVFSAL